MCCVLVPGSNAGPSLRPFLRAGEIPGLDPRPVAGTSLLFARLFSVCARTVHHGKRLRQAMLQDKAEFCRQQFEAARGAGPAKFAHLLRAITRQGRKFKPPQVLPVICHDGCEHIGAAEVTRVLGASYASAERALPVTPEALVQQAHQVQPLHASLDATQAPSAVDLFRGFVGQKTGRAPGASRLPAEVFQANPFAVTLAYCPVILKTLVRGVKPLHWTGGVAHSIPKGGKDPGTVAGWRAILLLESDSKAVQQAWRPYLIRSLHQVRSSGQHGGLPGHTLDQPSALLRAHLQGLHARQASGGALFVDCASAYYSVIRDFYYAGPCKRWSRAELQERAGLFFADPAAQSLFVEDVSCGRWLEAMQLPREVHRLLAAQLCTTWYADGRPGTTLYQTQSGTAPGSPVADALFAALFSRFLKGIEGFLRAAGISPHIEVVRQGHQGAEAPTWADDVVILFIANGAEDVPTVLAQLGSQVLSRLRELGLVANMGPGKTEAVVAIRGAHSRQVRRALLTTSTPSVAVDTQSQPGRDSPSTVPLRVVASYVHLGTTVNAELSEIENLRRRGALLRAAFKPMHNRLLRNPFLTFAEKRSLLVGRLVPIYLHGAGMWRLSTTAERELACGQLWAIYRRCVRPLTGHSSERLTRTEVLAALDMADPLELVRVAQVRACLQVLRPDMTACWAGFAADGIWLRDVCVAFATVCPTLAKEQRTAQALQDRDLPRLSEAILPLLPRVRQLCKSYLRTCRHDRPAVDWEDVQRRQGSVASLQVVGCAGLGFSFQCHLCTAAFVSKRRLAVHQAKRHGLLGIGRRHAFGTRCEVCSVEYWTEQRLGEHLSRSELCRRIYRESDIDGVPGTAKGAEGPSWRPCTLAPGPIPFWATLRPE